MLKIGVKIGVKSIFHVLHNLQELPKYIRGYHKVTVEEAMTIGALVYKVKHADDVSQMDNIT